MNNNLCKEFTNEEISNAMFQIGPLKAPGPDGFPARFFQRHWAVMKDDIINAVKLFFASGVMPDGINSTVIVLIPKIDSPSRVSGGKRPRSTRSPLRRKCRCLRYRCLTQVAIKRV